ncbi:MAG: flagellar hook-associated protein FlgK [Bacillus thermozeamaize]|uniref:Flagellar hook-associated protein 1 n=1 Tax=Bacillus thermozeamaize TaxID=230954 RepID=A0A1Y3PRP3_9BACI|nr:MAG: flagellar hook-associated protein FlgK [Bacillus thermozeamaize]
MPSTFHGIELLKRALYAQQAAMNTAGHNVSNAHTPGYSRQRVEMVTTPPIEMPGLNRSTAKGQLGTGVNVDAIRRLRDTFLDLQYRNENQYLGEWEVMQNTYDKLEVIFNEIKASDDGFGTGLNRVFNEFWNAWQDLSRDPESLTAKIAVVQRGVALAETFNTMARQLNTFEADLEKQTRAKVDQANVLLGQIAELNQQIVKIHAMGQNANDLMDRRDLLVDELSKLINIEVNEDANGGYEILLSRSSDDGTVNGNQIVLMPANGDKTQVLKFDFDTTDPANKTLKLKDVADNDVVDLYVIDGSATNHINEPSGEILGYLRSIEKVKGYHQQLDILVRGFVTKINDTYGDDLFEPKDTMFSVSAENIQFNQNLVANPVNLKTSNSGLSGDGDLARDIAQLRNALFDFNGEQATVADRYNGIIGKLGIESQEAQRRVKNHQLLVDQTEALRQSVSGVSLDEEMANLVMFQHAYNAAARAVTVMDQMLDKLINGTGIVGR